MASAIKTYYLLSHKLNGIFTRLHGLENLMIAPYTTFEEREQISKMIVLTIQDGYKLIEDLRGVLEFRAKHRHKKAEEFLTMVSTLYVQIEQKRINRKLVLAELNQFAEELKREVNYNLDLEKKEANN